MKGKFTANTRLSVDLAATRVAYKQFEIDCIRLILGDKIYADTHANNSSNKPLQSIIIDIFKTEAFGWITKKDKSAINRVGS